jgi:hypothetical protein
MHAFVSSKCEPLKVCPVASLRLNAACATSPRLDLLPPLPFFFCPPRLLSSAFTLFFACPDAERDLHSGAC